MSEPRVEGYAVGWGVEAGDVHDMRNRSRGVSFPWYTWPVLVSAWLPSSDTATPDKTVAKLKAAGIGTAVLMVNDFSDDRGPTEFRTFDFDRLVAMANACHDAEIVVWLCSWVMPHDVFIDGACRQLPDLREATRAEVIVWDAEEPWTKATGPFDYGRASWRLRDAFGYSRMGLTAIGSAPSECWDLAAACSVWMPQCYATRDSVARPSEVVPYSLRQWKQRYGEPSSWCIGLAAYDQAAVPADTMQPPIDDVREAEISSVCYWTSNAIASRPDVCEFVAGLSRARPPHPGICPELNLAAMPVGQRSQAVAEVQALLTAWGIDPGPQDGKPGPKTIAAVHRFQRRNGIETTGSVDAATWAELLRP